MSVLIIDRILSQQHFVYTELLDQQGVSTE